jgi:hypothetical protein
MPQLRPLMLRCPVVAVVEIAPQFTTVSRNPRFFMADVAPIAPAIFRKHRSRTQSDQQQNSSYRAFHMPFSFPITIGQ